MGGMTTRGVRSGVEDRWFKTVRNPDGTKSQVPSKNHGIPARWRARYVDNEGTERERVFPVKKDAETFLRDRMAAVHTGSHLDPRAGRVTVADQHSIWEAGRAHTAASTDKAMHYTWTAHVQPRWGKVAVADVRKTAVKSWVAKMSKDGAGAATVERAYFVLRGVMASAVDDRCILVNPCLGVPLPKREHADRGYLTHEQVAALSDAVSRDPLVPRFLAYTGLRWGEMAALRVMDFDTLRRRVNVSRAVTEVYGRLEWSTPKTWERRSVPYPAALSEPLAALMEDKPRDALVFTNTRGNVLRNGRWRDNVFTPAVEKCQAVDPDFPTITPHDLRHTSASLSVSAGANVLAVSRMLGHKDPSMTLTRYADLFDSDLDAVAAALDTAITAVAGSLRDRDAVPAT